MGVYGNVFSPGLQFYDQNTMKTIFEMKFFRKTGQSPFPIMFSMLKTDTQGYFEKF